MWTGLTQVTGEESVVKIRPVGLLYTIIPDSDKREDNYEVEN